MTQTIPREKDICGLHAQGFHRLRYLEWGEPENPNVIICVHGLSRNSRDFDYLAAELSNQYRVVCPDMPGRGSSEWLSEKSQYSYPVYIADIAILIGRLGVSEVDWIGTSMGGLIGMSIASLTNSPIKRMIVNDIGPMIEERALERIFDYVGRDPRFQDLNELEQYLRRIHAPFGALSDDQWKHLARYSARESEHGGYRLHYDPGIVDAFKSAPAGAVDMWSTWDRMNIPLLILRGEQSDLLSKATVKQMLARGPQSDLIEFPDVGHAPPLMSGVQISVIREWLNQN